MDEQKTSVWGILILVFLFFIVFTGNNVLGNGLVRGTSYADSGCSGISNCQVEKQTIINTATTQNLINDQNEKTRDYLGTKIDFYAYENLKDQLAQERTKNVVLENRVYSDARFNDITAQNVSLSREIERISCAMLKEPKVYGQAFVTTGSKIPSGCGIA